MTIIQLYHTMLDQIQHIIPTGHAYRTQNLAWFLSGLFQSGSVHLSKVANKIPGMAQRSSRVRRLSRFLHNGAVHVRRWYRPIATRLLQDAAKSGELRLIIDATKVAQNHQLLMVALAYRRRALPLAWTWIRSARGHSSGHKQMALLNYVHRLVPEEASVIVTGDSEFTPLQALLEQWDWFYVLRQKGSHLYRSQPENEWRPVKTLVTAPGQCHWLSTIELTQQYRHPCHFLAYWRRGEKEPWLLATNLPDARATKRHYKVRMWIEEMFGDFKGHGLDLEKSCLNQFLPLSRLTLVVAILYVWLIAFGASTVKRGKRYLVDRTDRRDLSIFRIGYDMFERCLINNGLISIRDVPYFI